MLQSKKPAPGVLTRPRTAVAVIAATFILGGGASEASAHSRHHHHRYHRHHNMHHADNAPWRDSNASIVASAGSGRTFSGIASHYGLEAGNKTASGQRMNPSAMTAAHRSLPFGTRLKVTHGDRSVVVTINDRGPFIRGRVLDLSNGAARAIGLGGTGRVVAEVQ